MVFIIVNELITTTQLSDYTVKDPIINWLWEVIKEYNQVELVSFYYFATGYF